MITACRLAAVLILCIPLTAAAQTIPEGVDKFMTGYTAGGYYVEVPGLFSSTNKCLARGYSTSVCDSARSMCAINSFVGTVFDRVSVLMEVFQSDCGDGICFACCFTGQGCHTSFYDPNYQPVLNCNEGYGPGTRQAGPTMIVDPNAKPGDACLFVGQSCDHLALCLSGKSPQEIQKINDDPNHLMKSPKAVSSRARNYATAMLGYWSHSLAGFHTSTDQPTDNAHAKVHDFFELNSFVTGRGCVGWAGALPASFPADWRDPHFLIADKDGKYADEASHYNGIRQLGLLRLLGSIPNLPARLAYVESRIWTPETIRQYLSSIGDPDSVFLRTMSPLALDVLKQNRQLQDYRLLAVPAPGEQAVPPRYNGCTLGKPPAVQLSYGKNGALGIDLQIGTASEAAEALAAWGDGSVTHLTIPAGTASRTVTHPYAAGGKYQVIVQVQNGSGLRTLGGLVIETASAAKNDANRPLPIVSEIQLVDLTGAIDSFAGNAMNMLFEVEGWPTAAQGYALGISRALRVELEKPQRFGTVVAWNTGAQPLQSVTIRPTRYGDGILIGFRKNYFTLDRIRIGVLSTQYRRMLYYDVPVTPDMVRLYAAGSNAAAPLTKPVFGPDGRLQIPVQADGVTYGRVDLLLPSGVLAQAVQGPIVDPKWSGFTGTLAETIPDHLAEPPGRGRPSRH